MIRSRRTVGIDPETSLVFDDQAIMGRRLHQSHRDFLVSLNENSSIHHGLRPCGYGRCEQQQQTGQGRGFLHVRNLPRSQIACQRRGRIESEHP